MSLSKLMLKISHSSPHIQVSSCNVFWTFAMRTIYKNPHRKLGPLLSDLCTITDTSTNSSSSIAPSLRSPLARTAVSDGEQEYTLLNNCPFTSLPVGVVFGRRVHHLRFLDSIPLGGLPAFCSVLSIIHLPLSRACVFASWYRAEFYPWKVGCQNKCALKILSFKRLLSSNAKWCPFARGVAVGFDVPSCEEHAPCDADSGDGCSALVQLSFQRVSKKRDARLDMVPC